MSSLGDLLSHSEARVSLAARALLARGHREQAEAWAWFVPGRIEVLGKHTDYAGGRSLLAATQQGFCLVAAQTARPRLRLLDLTRGVRLTLPLSAEATSPRGWGRYPLAVVRRLARDFPPIFGRNGRGLDLAFTNDLPSAAGVSTSSAFVVATFLALAEWCGLSNDARFRAHLASPEALAGYLGAVENGYAFGPFSGDHGVGTFGGSEDHTAILTSRVGTLRQVRFCPVVFERELSLPAGLVFAIASSGVEAAKADGAREDYNRASRLASEAAAIWRQVMARDEPHLAGVARSQGARSIHSLPSAFQNALSSDHSARVEHFLTESEELVPAAADALLSGDLSTFGDLVDRSQTLGARLLGNQIPETVFLARTAHEHGAAAASAFGAGFGGSVWALVRAVDVESFLANWRVEYHDAFPERVATSRWFWTPAGEGARRLVIP